MAAATRSAALSAYRRALKIARDWPRCAAAICSSPPVSAQHDARGVRRAGPLAAHRPSPDLRVQHGLCRLTYDFSMGLIDADPEIPVAPCGRLVGDFQQPVDEKTKQEQHYIRTEARKLMHEHAAEQNLHNCDQGNTGRARSDGCRGALQDPLPPPPPLSRRKFQGRARSRRRSERVSRNPRVRRNAQPPCHVRAVKI